MLSWWTTQFIITNLTALTEGKMCNVSRNTGSMTDDVTMLILAMMRVGYTTQRITCPKNLRSFKALRRLVIR